MATLTVDELMEVAFAVNQGDPIDWGVFRQGREESMKMIAASILEQFDKEEFTQEDIVIMLATITKLVTENMILHSQVLSKDNEV
jgi:hypothetical protein